MSPESHQSDQNRIQGAWRSVRIETLGYCADEDMGVGSLMVFEGDRVTIPDGTNFRFRLDPTTAPKQLDLLYADTEHAQFHAIYAFEGNRLVTCFNTYLSPRPVSFSTGEDVSDVLTHFERADDRPPGRGQPNQALPQPTGSCRLSQSRSSLGGQKNVESSDTHPVV